MMEKLLTFPFSTSQDRVDGVTRSKFNFFPEQHQHKPTKHLYRDNMRGSRIFFCQGEGVGPGSSTYFTVYRGGPMVLLHIFQGGGGGGGGGSKC